jgi:hypothetical protein
MLAVDIQARASSSLTMQYSKTPRPRPPSWAGTVMPKYPSSASRASRDAGIWTFCGSSSLATGSTSSMANRRACSCSFSRSGVCHGGSSTGGSGCQVSFTSLDVIVGSLLGGRG